MAYLLEVEGFDRGRYAGPVGWMDRNGDGAWAVGIRSAELRGHRARLFAGVGVVADSDPDGELAETQLKLQALWPPSSGRSAGDGAGGRTSRSGHNTHRRRPTSAH